MWWNPGLMSVHWALDMMVPDNIIVEHTLETQSSIQHEHDVVLLEIQHMVGLEVLETPCIYLCEGYNMVVSWCHSCALSLEHYGTQEQGWEPYIQLVAKFCMKWCFSVANTTYGGPGGVGNYFYIPMGRLEYGSNLVPWLFVESWTLWFPWTGLGSIYSRSS